MKKKKTLTPKTVEEAILASIPFNPPGLKYYERDADHILAGKGYVIRNGAKLFFMGKGFQTACAGTKAPLGEVGEVASCFMSPGLISCAGKKSAKSWFQFCAEAAINPKILEKTVFTVGFGANETIGGARLPAYIMPALEIMKKFFEANLPTPYLRILSGAQLGLHMNGFNQEKVLQTMEKNFKILHKFVKDFFPKLEGKVFFDYDLNPGDILDKVEDFRQNWLMNLERGSDEYKMLIALAGCAQKNGCASKFDGSSKYAIIHALIFGDVSVSGYPMTEWEKKTDRSDLTFISLGGNPERLFNFFRNYFSVELFNEAELRRSIRLIVQVGKKPVYYPVPGEPMFGKLQLGWLKAARENTSLKRNRIHFDYKALPKDYEGWAMDIKV